MEVLQSIYDGDSKFKQISSTSYQYKVLTLQSLVTHLNATRQRVTHHIGVGPRYRNRFIYFEEVMIKLVS